MKQLIIALSIITLILSSSLLASAFINANCDKMESLSLAILDHAKKGEGEKVVKLSGDFENVYAGMHHLLAYTSNHFDLRTLEVSYKQMINYLHADLLADAASEAVELQNTLKILRETERISFDNIF